MWSYDHFIFYRCMLYEEYPILSVTTRAKNVECCILVVKCNMLLWDLILCIFSVDVVCCR